MSNTQGKRSFLRDNLKIFWWVFKDTPHKSLLPLNSCNQYLYNGNLKTKGACNAYLVSKYNLLFMPYCVQEY